MRVCLLLLGMCLLAGCEQQTGMAQDAAAEKQEMFHNGSIYATGAVKALELKAMAGVRAPNLVVTNPDGGTLWTITVIDGNLVAIQCGANHGTVLARPR